MLKLSFLLALALSMPAHAQLYEDAVYLGKSVSAEGQTWKFSVGLEFQTQKGTYAACTGSFIEEDVILTAAHCRVKSNGLLNIKLYKQNNSTPVEMSLSGKDFYTYSHPGYKPTEGDQPGTNDVALIILRTARLPEGFETAEFFSKAQAGAANPGQSIFAVGTGRNENNEMSDRLYFAQGQISHYEAGDLMQIDFKNGQGMCGGDSGGPVLVKSGGKLYLAALTTSLLPTLNDNCGDNLWANFITAARYDWIQSKISAARAAIAIP